MYICTMIKNDTIIALKKESTISIDLSPESLITEMAPTPEGVAKAIIVSFLIIVQIYTG